LGFGQANNIGIKYALAQGAEYVFLLNQDAYLQEGCIETLIETHKKNTAYGILSPIHLNGQGNRLDRNFSNYINYTANPDFYSDFVLKKPLQEIYEVPFVNAAGWLLSRDILEKVGGFDPIFFHYGEDDNYCQRARFHGFKIGVVPTTFLYHDRAERPKKEIKHASSAYFELKEKNFKVKYANINEENLDKLHKLLKRRQKNRQRALFKLNFSNANYLKKEIDLLKQIIPQIEKSRQLGTKKGSFLYLRDDE
jgi:GT2 family glycosyltransferase